MNADSPETRRTHIERARELLPPADTARPDDYRALAVEDLLAQLDLAGRRAVLGELLRRRTGTDDEALSDALGAAAFEVQAALTSERIESRQRVVDAEIRADPLRARILNELTRGPAGPSELARTLDARVETMSRLCRQLEAERLVAPRAHPHDGRRKLYGLTPSGERAAADQLAFGPPAPPPEPIAATEAQIAIERGLAEAIRLRRSENRLDDAVKALEPVIREAAKYELPQLELRARREYATTLRQAQRTDELREQLHDLHRVAKGQEPRLGAECAMPASAHLHYELGRRAQTQASDDLAESTRLLLTAGSLFNAIAGSGIAGDRWAAREGWALFSAAENLRQQTLLGSSLRLADRAARLFESDDDAYGIANCLSLAGFALRLRGDFATAQATLAEALSLAQEQGFERLAAGTLVHLGEALRCQGQLAEAEQVLTDACDRARTLNASVTEAFSLSALGATAYCAEDPLRALTVLETACAAMEQGGHGDGLALTRRRKAVVENLLTEDGRGRTDLADVRELLGPARSRYKSLESAAGVAACLIELGRAKRGRGQRVGDVCASLIAWFEPIDRRDLFQRDPWIPERLVAFAEAADHPALHETATALRTDAIRRQEAREEPSRSLFTYQLQKHVTPVRRPPTGALAARIDQMAGEPRRHSPLAEPGSLVAA